MLAQLGNRVQHALRAFTPDDAKALRATVSTFPTSEFYDLEELFPALGIGEAAVTILDERGVPTPVVHTRMVAPRSRMAPARRRRRAARRRPCGRSTGRGRPGVACEIPRRGSRRQAAAGAGAGA